MGLGREVGVVDLVVVVWKGEKVAGALIKACIGEIGTVVEAGGGIIEGVTGVGASCTVDSQTRDTFFFLFFRTGIDCSSRYLEARRRAW